MLNHLHANPTPPKRVVVLGSHGFVGGAIVQALTELAVPVLGLSKTQVNLLEEDALASLEEILKPEDTLIMVSALAPCKDVTGLVNNLHMMKVVCKALEKNPVSHVVYISSDSVYADDANPVTESSSLQPSTLHGMMHSSRELMLKSVVKAAGKSIPLALLRPSLLYGEKDPHNGYGPNRFRRLALQEKPITLFGGGEEKRDHVFIEDVAKIVSLVVQHKSDGFLNIATGHSLSFKEVAETIVAMTGSSSEIKTTMRENPITHRHFDISACHKAFPQFKYTTFKEGIQRTIAVCKEFA